MQAKPGVWSAHPLPPPRGGFGPGHNDVSPQNARNSSEAGSLTGIPSKADPAWSQPPTPAPLGPERGTEEQVDLGAVTEPHCPASHPSSATHELGDPRQAD